MTLYIPIVIIPEDNDAKTLRPSYDKNVAFEALCDYLIADGFTTHRYKTLQELDEEYGKHYWRARIDSHPQPTMPLSIPGVFSSFLPKAPVPVYMEEEITANKFGNFMDEETKLVFSDEVIVIGKQNMETGEIMPLTRKDIEICSINEWEYANMC